jgi:hypothetical protein
MPVQDFKSIKTIEVTGNLSNTGNNKVENREQTECIEQLFVVRGGYLVDKYYPNEEDDTYDF